MRWPGSVSSRPASFCSCTTASAAARKNWQRRTTSSTGIDKDIIKSISYVAFVGTIRWCVADSGADSGQPSRGNPPGRSGSSRPRLAQALSETSVTRSGLRCGKAAKAARPCRLGRGPGAGERMGTIARKPERLSRGYVSSRPLRQGNLRAPASIPFFGAANQPKGQRSAANRWRRRVMVCL